MASSTDWTPLLDARYASYTVEVEAFLDSLSVSNSNEVSVEYIFNAIKYDPSIPDNLKLLYGEAVHGTDKEVRTRMKSRVANFKRTLK